MIPAPDKALTDLAVKLATSLMPEIGSAYGAANAGMLSMLLMALAQDYDRAVANRYADIEQLRGLFSAANNPPMAKRLNEFSSSQPISMALSDVSAWHGAGMTLLIELHAWA